VTGGDFRIRPATTADVEALAAHRVGMFRDMGVAPPALHAQLHADCARSIRAMMASGEYVAWVALPDTEPGRIVGGAGVQLRKLQPFPRRDGTGIAPGKEALVRNVYTEPEFHRRGIARALMRAVMAWSRAADIDSLVLHAAPDGRALYESLGFSPTNEMRFQG